MDSLNHRAMIMVAAGSGITRTGVCAERDYCGLSNPLNRVMVMFAAGSGVTRAGHVLNGIKVDSLILFFVF